MTFPEFLEACRIRAGIKTKSEMGRAMGFDAKHYINLTNGSAPPGRDVLEAAAKVAGFSLEDCLQLPDEKVVDAESEVRQENAAVYDTIRRALKNWKRQRVIELCYGIETWKREPQHVKHGGRVKRRPE